MLAQVWKVYLIAGALLGVGFIVLGLRRGSAIRDGRRFTLIGVGWLGLALTQLVPRPHSVVVEVVSFIGIAALIYAFAITDNSPAKSGAT